MEPARKRRGKLGGLTAALRAPDRPRGGSDTGGGAGSIAMVMEGGEGAGEHSPLPARGSPQRRRRPDREKPTPATAQLSTVRQALPSDPRPGILAHSQAAQTMHRGGVSGPHSWEHAAARGWLGAACSLRLLGRQARVSRTEEDQRHVLAEP